MSITISKTFEIAGVPTDPTSFDLGNEAGTLGVKRNDTGALVVAAGTAMTRIAEGVYQYTFVEPAASLTYTAYYHIVYAGNDYYLEDVVQSSGIVEIPMPDLTGDDLVDTLAALQVERLRVARAGPKVTYTVHGHHYDWNGYMRMLDQRIAAIRAEIAMTNPLEEVGLGM